MRDRRPGDFSRQLIGKQTSHAKHGWRRFMLSDPLILVEDPSSMVSGVVESTGNTVVTLTDVIGSSSEHPTDYACYQMPLTDALGVPVNFLEPFVLRTMCEFISVTGDFDDSANEHDPAFGFGIGQNATDIDGSSTANKFLATGQVIYDDVGGDPRFKRLQGYSSGSGSKTRVLSSALTSNTPALAISNWYIGPSVGSSNADANSCRVTTTFFDTSGNSYAKNTNVNAHTSTIGNDNDTYSSDNNVYLFAWFGSYVDTNGSADPAVVTVRFWYMVNHNIDGWRGTGAA